MAIALVSSGDFVTYCMASIFLLALVYSFCSPEVFELLPNYLK